MSNAMERLERAICSEQGPLVLRTLSRLSSRLPLGAEERAVLGQLADLGLGRLTASGLVLDEFGHKCADAALEYSFWKGRGRRLPFEDEIPALAMRNFQGARILEIGSGWGCNLFRLQHATPHVRGRELEEVYVRFTSIFAKLEGVAAPPIDLGPGEALPYAEHSFDVVLVWSAFQYMDIHAVAREAARVLAPGGRLIAAQPLLRHLFAGMPRTLRRPGALVRLPATLANSLSYGLLGRRLFGNLAGRSTARPVYLTRRRIIAIVESTGLTFLPSPSDSKRKNLMLLVAEKSRDPGSRRD